MRIVLAVIMGVVVEVLVSLLSLFVPWLGSAIQAHHALSLGGFFATYEGLRQWVAAVLTNPNPLFYAGQIVVLLAVLYALLGRRSSGRLQSAAGYGVHGSSTWGSTQEIRPSEATIAAITAVQSEIQHSLAVTERVRA